MRSSVTSRIFSAKSRVSTRRRKADRAGAPCCDITRTTAGGSSAGLLIASATSERNRKNKRVGGIVGVDAFYAALDDGGASWREIARFAGVSSDLETRLEQIFSLGAQGGATGPPPSSPSRPSTGDAARRLADLYRDSLRYVPRDGGRSQPSPGTAPDPILGGRVVPETFGLWGVDPDAVQKILDDLWKEKKAAVDERLRRLVVNMVALNGAATFAVVWLALKLFRRKEKE